MIAYLIKGIVCSAVLWLFHYCFLEKEKLHGFNRLFLLLAPLVSFIIPFLPLREAELAIPVLGKMIAIAPATPQNVAAPVVENAGWFTEITVLQVLAGVYLLGVLIRLFRLGRSLRVLRKIARMHKQYPTPKGIIVAIPNHQDICTYMQYVFCDKEAYEKSQIPEQILRHEFAHVRQKHSWDILYMEIIGALYWFNPVMILFRRSIVLNHEFLADQDVNKVYKSVNAYQTLLIDRLTGSAWGLASGFNYAQTKKRLIMMTQSKNWTRITIKGLGLVLVTSGMIYLAAGEVIAQKTQQSYMNMLPPPPPFDATVNGPGLSKSELSDYTASFEKHTKVTKDANGKRLVTFSFTDREKDRLWGLAEKMTATQQGQAKYQIILIPLPEKKPPTDKIFAGYTNIDMTKYVVWIDGQMVDKATLKKYRATDIADHWVQSAGDAVNLQRVQLITHKAFDKRNEEMMENKYIIQENPSMRATR